MRKNHLRHYTLVPHVYIGFALSHCNRLQELTATMVTPRNTVPMETCPSFRNDFYKRYSKSVTETPDKKQRLVLTTNGSGSHLSSPEVTCRLGLNRRCNILTSSCLQSELEDDIHLGLEHTETRQMY